MLLHENQVRLTRKERDILRRLTGADPYYVTTRAQLKEWSERYLSDYPGDSPEIRKIKDVIRRHLPLC